LRSGKHKGETKPRCFANQIRYTVEEHFRKQERLKKAGIKVLSLFFIDRVDNFIGNPPADKTTIGVDGLYPGIIRELFDDAFETLKLKYQDFSAKSARDVRGSYFAKKKRRGGVEIRLIPAMGKARKTGPRTTSS